MKKTSIIILAYKEPEKFKRMFETLLKHTHNDITPYEIIVFDNGSDRIMKTYLTNMLNKKKINLLISVKKNIGVTKGYNMGEDMADGEYLCFFNSDYYVIDNWLESMIKCFEHRDDIGIASLCTNVTGNPLERPKGITYHTIFDEATSTEPILHNDYIEADCAIANMFTTKTIFNEVGGFDENYFVAFLDLDLNEKIKAKGYKAFVNRKCFAVHDYLSEKESIIHNESNKGREYFRKKWGDAIADMYKWA